MRNKHTFFLTLGFLLFSFTSCLNSKKLVYLDNIGDAEISRKLDNLEPEINKNDLLSITVTSPNPTATQIFNPTKEASTQAGGYLVNQEGFIEFPILGPVKAAGRTKTQLKNDLAKTLVQKQLLLDPVITIRFLNYKVTVLGEVARPTVINVTDEKISLLEALGLAGDMTVYARRDNVLIIRELEGKRVTKRINLNSRELFTSPFYYLKSNDVVYVEPGDQKAATMASARQQWIPIVVSAVSLASLLMWRLNQ